MGVRLSWALLAISIVALFLGAMRGTNYAVEQATIGLFTLVYVTLTAPAIVAGRRGPGLVGLVVFGWAYFVPALMLESEWVDAAPTTWGMKAFILAVNPRPPLPPGFASSSPTFDASHHFEINDTGASTGTPQGDMAWGRVQGYQQVLNCAVTVGHLLVAILWSLLGAILTIAGHRFLLRPKLGGTNSQG